MTNGQAIGLGISDTRMEKLPRTANNASAAITQCDGRHSGRQLGDAMEERCDFGIVRSLMTQEPAPELIVFAIQQA